MGKADFVILDKLEDKMNMDNVWTQLLQLIESYENNPIFSLVANIRAVLGAILSIIIHIIPWTRAGALGKNWRAYKGVVLDRICDYKYSDWVRRAFIFIAEFFLLLLNISLILVEMYFSIFLMGLRNNDFPGKVFMSLYIIGCMLAILIICTIRPTREITKSIKWVLLIWGLTLFVIVISIAFVPVIYLNKYIYYIFFVISVVTLPLINYFIHKGLKIKNGNIIIALMVGLRYLVFVLYLVHFFIFHHNDSYVIYIWFGLCVIENWVRWTEEDKNNACSVDLCTSYGREITRNPVIRYGDNKVAFKTENGSKKVLNICDIRYIRYQKRNFTSKDKKRGSVFCQFSDGLCIQYDHYKFIDKQWIEFYSDTDNIRMVEIYKSEDIVKIQEN